MLSWACAQFRENGAALDCGSIRCLAVVVWGEEWAIWELALDLGVRWKFYELKLLAVASRVDEAAKKNSYLDDNVQTIKTFYANKNRRRSVCKQHSYGCCCSDDRKTTRHRHASYVAETCKPPACREEPKHNEQNLSRVLVDKPLAAVLSEPQLEAEGVYAV